MFNHLSVKDCMKHKVTTLKPNQTIVEVIDIMLREGIGGAPVLSDTGEMIGFLGMKDCLDAIIADEYYDQHTSTVSGNMKCNIKTVSQDNSLIDLALEFSHCSYHRFPVTNSEGKLVGIISRKDVLTGMKRVFDEDHRHGPTSGHRG